MELSRKPLDVLCSYFYAKSADMQGFINLFERKPFLISDSGGFSAHSLGTDIDIGEYADWLIRWSGIIDVAANLDIKGNLPLSEQNLRYLESRGIKNAMPVFHGGEDLGALREMAAAYPVVFVGNVVGSLPSSHPKMRNFLDKVFEIADGQCGLHGFGVANTKVIKQYPWWSCDATTWKSGGRYGVVAMYDKPTHNVRTVKLGSKEFSSRANELSYMTDLDWRDYAYRSRVQATDGRLFHYAKPSLAAFEIFKAVEQAKKPPVKAEGYPDGLHFCYAANAGAGGEGKKPTDPEALAWIDRAVLRV